MAHIHWSCLLKIIIPFVVSCTLFPPSQILWSCQILRNWVMSISTFYCTDTTTPILATWCWYRFNGSNQGIKLRSCRGIGRSSIWHVYRSQCLDLKSMLYIRKNIEILITINYQRMYIVLFTHTAVHIESWSVLRLCTLFAFIPTPITARAPRAAPSTPKTIFINDLKH